MRDTYPYLHIQTIIKVDYVILIDKFGFEGGLRKAIEKGWTTLMDVMTKRLKRIDLEKLWEFILRDDHLT